VNTEEIASTPMMVKNLLQDIFVATVYKDLSAGGVGTESFRNGDQGVEIGIDGGVEALGGDGVRMQCM